MKPLIYQGNTNWDNERLNSFVRMIGISASPSFKAALVDLSGPRLKNGFAEWAYLSKLKTTTEIYVRVTRVLSEKSGEGQSLCMSRAKR